MSTVERRGSDFVVSALLLLLSGCGCPGFDRIMSGRAILRGADAQRALPAPQTPQAAASIVSQCLTYSRFWSGSSNTTATAEGFYSGIASTHVRATSIIPWSAVKVIVPFSTQRGSGINVMIFWNGVKHENGLEKKGNWVNWFLIDLDDCDLAKFIYALGVLAGFEKISGCSQGECDQSAEASRNEKPVETSQGALPAQSASSP